MSLPVIRSGLPSVDPLMLKHWPDSTLTKIQDFGAIFQIQFYIPSPAPSDLEKDGQLVVMSQNLYVLKRHPNSSQAQGKFWRYIPSFYNEFLHRLIYRMDLYIFVTEAIVDRTTPHFSTTYSTQYQSGVVLLKDYLKYTDTVMDAIWEEARIALNNDEMTLDWRSKILDQWLLKEYFIHQHSPAALFQHDVQKLPLDMTALPEHLGMFFFSYDITLLIISLNSDWSLYETKVLPWHSGKTYDWSFSTLTLSEKVALIPQVLLWCEKMIANVDLGNLLLSIHFLISLIYFI